jgi:predicted transcriptional regulator of viral defense system
MLHDLSDVLPARAHLTVPAAWRERRLRVPDGVVLHYADVRKPERVWIRVVPVTSVPRTLADCAADHLSPDLLSAAVDQALTRGVVAKREIAQVQRVLEDAGLR